MNSPSPARVAHNYIEPRVFVDDELAKTIVESGDPPVEIIDDLVNGLSNGIGFACADYTYKLSEPLRDQLGKLLYERAIREFARLNEIEL